MLVFDDFDVGSDLDSAEFDNEYMDLPGFEGAGRLDGFDVSSPPGDEFDNKHVDLLGFERAGRPSQKPTVVHTASISIQSDGVQVCITSLSGETKGAMTLAAEATIRQLEAGVKDMYQWTSVSFFSDDGHEVDKADHLKDHNRLTMRARLPRFPMRKLDAAQQPDSTLPEVLGLQIESRGARWRSDYSDLDSDYDYSTDGDSCHSYASNRENGRLTFVEYARDSRRSKFVNSSTGAEVSPDDINLNGVRSLAIKRAEVHLQDFAYIENCFPCLERFEYSVADGYGYTYDLRSLANPSWSRSLKTLRLHLGPCHISEGAHGLEVLGPLSNLEVFDVSHLRHASLKDLKVVENFPALVELSFRGAVDSGSDAEIDVALNLSKHVMLRKVEFEPYCGSLDFCAPGERRGIQLYLPFLEWSGNMSGSTGNMQKISVRLQHEGHSMFTRRLRNALVESGIYRLDEFLLSSFDRKAESVSPARMNELWCKDFLECAKFRQDDYHSRTQREIEARAGVVEFFSDEESVLLPSLFPPSKLFGLESKPDLHRWVRYSDLQPRRIHYEVGDRCFLLGLIGPTNYGSIDLLTGSCMFHSGSLCCSVRGDLLSSLVFRNSKGLFMVECQVQKKNIAASARLVQLKCEMAAEGFEGVMAQEHKEEYEYSVKFCGNGANIWLTAAFVHESFLFSEIPSGWTSREVSMRSPISGAGLLVFPVSLPPDHILKGIPVNSARPHPDPSRGHPIGHNRGGMQLHKRQRTEDSTFNCTETTLQTNIAHGISQRIL